MSFRLLIPRQHQTDRHFYLISEKSDNIGKRMTARSSCHPPLRNTSTKYKSQSTEFYACIYRDGADITTRHKHKRDAL